MAEWVVSVHRRVEEVADWDDIAGGGLFASAAWLRAFAPDVPLFLVCVRDRSGAPVAAACACLAERPGVLAHGAEPGFAFKHPTAAVARPPDGELYPFLLVGPPRGYAGRLLLRGDDPAARREALAALLDGVRGAAAAAGARLVSFAFLSLDELAEVAALEPRLVPSFGFTDFRLPVDSFAGYLAARGSYRARNAVEREMRNFAGEGFATEVRRLGDVMHLAVPLIVGVTRKH
ncbi:MAG TPA: hypothetical protein VNO33_03510, partial [Kofleriaceae bacterium]|nr:hypothetical protein [Kofleriaceae bacterium]